MTSLVAVDVGVSVLVGSGVGSGVAVLVGSGVGAGITATTAAGVDVGNGFEGSSHATMAMATAPKRAVQLAKLGHVHFYSFPCLRCHGTASSIDSVRRSMNYDVEPLIVAVRHYRPCGSLYVPSTQSTRFW